MIVVLSTPSVAQRIAHVRYATEAQERIWTSQAFAAQQQVLTTLAAEGISVRPDFSYARVLDGFSAQLDGRAVALLEHMPEVVGVYPVRAAYPASVSETLLSTKEFDAGSGHRPAAELPGYDGHGVTIALLDTGVDEAHPYLRGKVLPGIDLVGNGADASAQASPSDSSEIERHGTELAGILVGSGGPGGLHGVAPGATVLPIRVAGWQPAADGRDLVYARSDQLIAGLDRAVDPNGDGDAHDAVRVAVVGVVEPYAAFTDSPEARAVQGALDLNTVVVTPTGNDGAAAPLFGSIAGPAGAPAALAVGATDSRTSVALARVVLRRGLDVIFDERVPLLGPVAPSHALNLQVATAGGAQLGGRAVLAPAGADPRTTVLDASRAGAAAVVLYGAALPAGGLTVSEDATAPAVVVPTAVAEELLAARRAGIDVGISVGAVHTSANDERDAIAGFSSQGLSFDGSVKPDIAAQGVGIATSEPGSAADGSALYGTVNGTSASAATVGGAAALLAQLRPALDGPALESLLVGYAARGGAAATATGAGTLRLGASAVGEIAAQPATLGFGIWGGSHWHATRTIVVRNVSTRRLVLSLSALAGGDSEALQFLVSPNHLALAAGAGATVQVSVRASTAPQAKLVTGAVEVSAAGSETLRIPWALSFASVPTDLIAGVTLSSESFKPSDTAPALLTVRAGTIAQTPSVEIQAVSRLQIALYTAGGRFIGTLAELRDLLPGAYSFGITGRGPSSARLAPGSYELRIAAWPTLPLTAKPSRAQVRFTIE